jgi:hypothetical protein
MEESREKASPVLSYFAGSLIVIIGLLGVYHWLLGVWLGPVEGPGEFGDQFGAMNALITGAAFFGLMLSVMIQSRDLRSQTRALELQQEALQLQITEFKEQKEELRRTAEAQERANNLAELELRADVLKERVAFNLTKMQVAGKAGGIAYTNPEGRVADLLQKLELLVNGDRDQSPGPTGD